jgi:hypothetical protein
VTRASPSPFRESTTLRLAGEDEEAATARGDVEVIDASGRVVRRLAGAAVRLR